MSRRQTESPASWAAFNLPLSFYQHGLIFSQERKLNWSDTDIICLLRNPTWIVAHDPGLLGVRGSNWRWFSSFLWYCICIDRFIFSQVNTYMSSSRQLPKCSKCISSFLTHNHLMRKMLLCSRCSPGIGCGWRGRNLGGSHRVGLRRRVRTLLFLDPTLLLGGPQWLPLVSASLPGSLLVVSLSSKNPLLPLLYIFWLRTSASSRSTGVFHFLDIPIYTWVLVLGNIGSIPGF